MKHAYLILAHNEPDMLRALLLTLDDVRNDVFVHIDRRAVGLAAAARTWRLRHAGLYVLPDAVAAFWGHESLLDAMLLLFRTASGRGRYGAYHLLSGVDLPLKTQDEIHAFFEAHPDREFVAFWDDAAHARDLRRKVDFHHFFVRDIRRRRDLRRQLSQPLRKLSFAAQRLLRLRRRSGGLTFRKGSQWVSLTDVCVRRLLSDVAPLRRRLRRTLCPDEILVQTFVWNCPDLRCRLFSPRADIASASLRLIDWERGGPYVWTAADADELLASPALFARKFSSADFDIVRTVALRAGADVARLDAVFRDVRGERK